MRSKTVLNIIGKLLMMIGISMIFPLIWAFYYREKELIVFIISIIATFLSGFALSEIKSQGEGLRPIESLGVVSLGWAAFSAFGALPFFLSGTLRYLDAYFETMSGFTTTGATVIQNIDILPKSIIFWRAMTQWMGGMGIIVLAVAILPALSIGGMQLFNAESPGPKIDKLKPQVRDTAKILYGVYLIFTAAEIILLIIGGMGFFDASCYTFSTLATGGFSTKNLSVAYYNNPFIEGVITLFMYLSGANFMLHYAALRGKLDYFKNKEFLFYSTIIASSIIIMAVDLRYSVYNNIIDAIRYSSFQVVSIITTTGFVSSNYDVYPAFSRMILLILMFIGGCACSTGGGIKNIRILVLLKYFYREIYQFIHPNAILAIKVGEETISDDVIKGIMGFFVGYISIFVIATVLVTSYGIDLITSISSVATTLGNVGPGMGLVGPMYTFSFLPNFVKIVLTFCMWIGRLEIFSVMVLFMPDFWKE
ncbi:MAG: potassium transporter [Candidatus Methanofastidiosum methylothiophilum]|jgi:trk system potassium uptake protein TrkH|uniref:Potassium transporter n=1 Tax=Candidatus Methanofastidiosum methylothiophilum TaxID=1705564 RepID=A0A150JCJ3_9EURY|nr:MAG: potassium transporter [Candidatus Methanofastidiosum methylthiophilus]MBP6932352.1 TrkH family potassium uptake protein [Methanofastidiosum sp.]OQC52702.1 MAG: potassium transporter [Euryarchaeota archaeon ADurb.Bin023]KYC56437.1 MAG: potassium transporter [Candidatus Methanofastidiosum methylthiophilus]KYC58284.1 MAG: potassium transporter [Candidatus Methanofastidiosum methylthiophilus]